MSAEEKAGILLGEVMAALARGTQHWDLNGNLLTTPKQIIEALLRDGAINFEPIEEKESSCA